MDFESQIQSSLDLLWIELRSNLGLASKIMLAIMVILEDALRCEVHSLTGQRARVEVDLLEVKLRWCLHDWC